MVNKYKDNYYIYFINQIEKKKRAGIIGTVEKIIVRLRKN